MNLFNKYLLLATFETDDNYLIRFEMKKHYSHSTRYHSKGCFTLTLVVVSIHRQYSHWHYR